MGKREPAALLGLSSWCLVMVERLFLAVPRGCLQFVIVVFPDHTYLLFLMLAISCKHLCESPWIFQMQKAGKLIISFFFKQAHVRSSRSYISALLMLCHDVITSCVKPRTVMCIGTPLKMPSQDISYDYGLLYLIETSRALAPPNGLIAYGHTLLSFYMYNSICYFSPYLYFLFVFDCTDCVPKESLVLAFWVFNAFLHPVLFCFCCLFLVVHNLALEKIFL